MRQGQEPTAVISSRENLPESNDQLKSGFDWEGQALSRHVGFRAALHRIVGKNNTVQVITSEPPPITVPVEASTESLRAAPLEGIDGSFSWGGGQSQNCHTPLSFSARDLTDPAAVLGGHALGVVEGLNVRM